MLEAGNPGWCLWSAWPPPSLQRGLCCPHQEKAAGPSGLEPLVGELDPHSGGRMDAGCRGRGSGVSGLHFGRDAWDSR